MKKLVIVINGQGRSGKDTVCKIVAKRYKSQSVSEIDPIKDIAKYAGWSGEKDDKSRKMLFELKKVFVEYSDLPFRYAMRAIDEFALNDGQFLFVHIREGDEITKIVKNSPLPIKTLLVKRNDGSFVKHVFGNDADDLVETYPYDFVYNGNNADTHELESDFMAFFDKNIATLVI